MVCWSCGEVPNENVEKRKSTMRFLFFLSKLGRISLRVHFLKKSLWGVMIQTVTTGWKSWFEHFELPTNKVDLVDSDSYFRVSNSKIHHLLTFVTVAINLNVVRPSRLFCRTTNFIKIILKI